MGFNASDPMAGGRFVILRSKYPSSVAPSWIPEQEARIILNQVDGFDPAKQPRSFDDFSKAARSKAIEKDAHIENMQKLWGDSTRANRRTRNGFAKDLKNHRELWTIGASIVVALLVLLAILRRLRSQTGL